MEAAAWGGGGWEGGGRRRAGRVTDRLMPVRVNAVQLTPDRPWKEGSGCDYRDPRPLALVGRGRPGRFGGGGAAGVGRARPGRCCLRGPGASALHCAVVRPPPRVAARGRRLRLTLRNTAHFQLVEPHGCARLREAGGGGHGAARSALNRRTAPIRGMRIDRRRASVP